MSMYPPGMNSRVMEPACSLRKKGIDAPFFKTASSAAEAQTWPATRSRAIQNVLEKDILIQLLFSLNLFLKASPKYLFQGLGYSAFGIAGRELPAILLQFL